MEVRIILLTVFLVALPALGAALAGQPLHLYFEFPPISHYRVPTAFSWVGFAVMALLLVSLLALLAVLAFGPARPFVSPEQTRRAFPWWGWLGVAVVAVGALAEGLGMVSRLWSLRVLPLMVGYILIVNALTWSRAGRCLLHDQPGYFLALFPASGLMWWYLEYLNRYVQNWYFVGIEQSPALDYFLQSTLAFSTLVPAVMATRQLLATFPRLMARLHTGRPVARHHVEPAALLLLTLAVLGLMGAGAWPGTFFPLLWMSPVFLITAFQLLSGEPTVFAGVRRGDWSRVILPALAALLVAVVMQLADLGGSVRWEYDLPLLQRFELLNLPLIGYAAYLPFGILCVQVADMVGRKWHQRRRPPAFPIPIKAEAVRLPPRKDPREVEHAEEIQWDRDP